MSVQQYADIVMINSVGAAKGELGSSGREQSPSTDDMDPGEVKEFGHNITFKSELEATPLRYQSYQEGDLSKKGALAGSGYDSLSDDEELLRQQKFTEAFLKGLEVSMETGRRRGGGGGGGGGRGGGGGGGGEGGGEGDEGSGAVAMVAYDSTWLVEKCKECVDGMTSMSGRELFSALFDLLSSPDDNTAIQNRVRGREEGKGKGGEW